MNMANLSGSQTVRIWDLPTRLFHWALVFSVIGAFITVKMGNMDWHIRLGEWVFCLILFRIIWGLIGPHYARFSQFIKGPKSIATYLKDGKKVYGHNPLGAISVIALLALFGFQAVTGLYTGDGYFYQGPLYSIGRGVRDTMTSWHHQMEIWMILLFVLHVGAVFFYKFFKKDNLLTPMITGKASLAGDAIDIVNVQQTLAMWIRFIIALGIAVLVTYYISNGLAF
ncbi:MAG: cytochrome B [Alcaligenaceae bacterium]|nr:cytochrome B [Alcaligenaceae bacterium]HZJ98310.1 cytochrome b/b6 domain-containing protein [Oligella sp.]